MKVIVLVLVLVRADIVVYGIAVLSFFHICGIAVSYSPAACGFSSSHGNACGVHAVPFIWEGGE